MSTDLLWHRLQFAFTITYHYLFPQLTMGLALLLVVLKVLALRTADERYNEVARFWARIFGLNFAMGVVTGIPLEFQFGTNWARFSNVAGGIIGQSLALEGVFAFILESATTHPLRSPCHSRENRSLLGPGRRFSRPDLMTHKCHRSWHTGCVTPRPGGHYPGKNRAFPSLPHRRFIAGSGRRHPGVA
jgi:Cytochrome bd terminal oxidase subunit I